MPTTTTTRYTRADAVYKLGRLTGPVHADRMLAVHGPGPYSKVVMLHMLRQLTSPTHALMILRRPAVS